MLISYYIMVISKMAAKMAAVTQKLAYLLNYLLQISREGVYHWLFWRHIYLYQIKVHILMMSSRNPRWLPVYKHWYIFHTIQSWEKYEKVNDHRCYIITKKFPQNGRELRMVAEEAFRGIIQDKPLHCSGDLMQILETEASKSHSDGLWNGIWNDMKSETTYMRYGHAPGGIVGITLKPETLKVWALSLHACSWLESDLDDMTDEDTESKVVTTHNEEAKARIAEDKRVRGGIRQKIETCSNPLDSAAHPSGIVNVVSGQIGSTEVNVHNAVTIGTEQMEVFESRLPQGLYETTTKRVVTMDHARKHVKVGAVKVFDTNLIYSRVIGLQARERDSGIKDVLGYELAPVPTSMFDDTGDRRIAKSKSTLKKVLQVEVSDRVAGGANFSVLGGSAILWVVPWPADGSVKDYIANFKYAIEKRLRVEDVYLIFDRYYDYHTKCVTRGSRTTGVSRVHHLQVNSKLPAQKILLASSKKKCN